MIVYEQGNPTTGLRIYCVLATKPVAGNTKMNEKMEFAFRELGLSQQQV